MTRPRVTVARLMTIVLFLGLGFAALRNNADKNAEIVNLLLYIDRMQTGAGRDHETLTTIIQELRFRLERPDGYVFDVDQKRREVKINVTRGQGALLLLKMRIFDSASPAVPAEKPKGTIELTQLGERFSTARIIETDNSSGPIRVGDIVHSPVWSPDTPVQFAMLGKVDLNRDGKDDRDELKRMIQQAGGIIGFDLPPPDVGKEIGALSPRIDWYVIDELFITRDPSYVIPPPEVRFAERKGEAIKEARRNGIRPMPIERLLSFLDDEMSPPAVARSETEEKGGIRRATGPSQPKAAP